MGVLVRKEKGVFIFTGIGKLSIVGLLVALASSFVTTVWAIYIDSFVKNIALVGFISAALILVAFLSRFLLIPIIEKSSKSKIFSYTLLASIVVFILFAINTTFYFFIILALISTVVTILRSTSFGIMIRGKSAKRQLSKNEGLAYTFLNLAWVVGPLIASYVLITLGMSKVFVLSAIFFFIAFIFFRKSKIKNVNIKKRVDKNVIKNFLVFFKSRERRFAYLLGGGVNLWWVLIYLFMPLFIIRNGLTESWVGYFLFAVAVPLISLEFLFAKLAGKIGFKKIFKIGFIIPCILVFICFFISNIYIILLLLVLASIGLAMLEPTTEAYFFDLLKGKQELRFYGPYNTTISVNKLIGRLLPSFALIFLPFKFIFLLFSLFMFIMFLTSFRIKDVVEKRRGGKKRKDEKIDEKRDRKESLNSTN
jgi:MFS family permease